MGVVPVARARVLIADTPYWRDHVPKLCTIWP